MTCTVIVPSSGSGTRLGLPFPKELVPIAKNQVLIDLTFSLLLECRVPLRVVVVVRADKLLVTEYVMRRYGGQFDIAFVCQRPDELELIGGVRSARTWFGDHNLVMLPDQFLASDGIDLVGDAFKELQRADVSMLVYRSTNPALLADEGAVEVRGERPRAQRVVYMRDKPGKCDAGFNAVWAAFGFQREVADDVLTSMEQLGGAAALDRAAFEHTVLYGAPVLEVQRYCDLGTWPRLRAFLSGNSP